MSDFLFTIKFVVKESSSHGCYSIHNIHEKKYSILIGCEQYSSSVTRQCKKCNSLQKV